MQPAIISTGRLFPVDTPCRVFRLLFPDRVRLSLLQPLFYFTVYVPKPAAFAAGELPAPVIVHVIPWRASEILIKDFYHVLFDVFHGFAELHSFCQFFKNRHFSFLPPRRAGPVSALPGPSSAPGGWPRRTPVWAFRLSERERKRREHFMQPFEATRVVIHQPSEEHPALCVQIEVNPILEALKLLFHFSFTSVSFLVRVYVTSG